MGLTYVVTGANRGLGLEFARQLAARGDTVIGTARAGRDRSALEACGAEIVDLDVADDASVEAFAGRLEGRPIDVLIANAGRQNRAAALADLDFADLADTFEVNTLGPLRVARALLPHLRAGQRRLLAFLASRVGSFGEFERGNMYGYRASKAALNMFLRCIAGELGREGFLCLALHPGWVRTDMGGPDATLSPAQSVKGLIRVIDRATERHNGAFLDHRGKTLPW